MIVPTTREAINERILNCERNIRALEHSPFSYKEKRELREIYQGQIDKYKSQRELSFLKLTN